MQGNIPLNPTPTASRTGSPFRILALDGGGIRGAYSAQVLASLEESTGERFVDNFDLIVGTSTGGLLAVGLAMGVSAPDLADFYRQHGPSIFPHASLADRTRSGWRQLFKPKYDGDALREALESVLGTSTMREARTRLAIPAFDITEGRIFVFKTRHHPRFVHDVDVRAVDVALATSAAPTFFPAKLVRQHAQVEYVDGGVWANTPTLVGVVEAIAFLDQQLEDIAVLSIGTTSATPDFSDDAESGALKWGSSLIELFMSSQSQSASAMAALLLGDRHHRIDALVPPAWRSLDNAKRATELMARGSNDARKAANLEVVTRLFLTGEPARSFGPVQGTTDSCG